MSSAKDLEVKVGVDLKKWTSEELIYEFVRRRAIKESSLSNLWDGIYTEFYLAGLRSGAGSPNHWIDCSDRLPEQCQRVLIEFDAPVTWSQGTVAIAFLTNDQWLLCGLDEIVPSSINPDRWLPLPMTRWA